MILGLVAANDADLLEAASVKHSEEIPSRYMPAYRSMRAGIVAILAAYDYTASPDFLKSTAGKSEAAVAMKRRFESEPVKRVAHRKKLVAALAALPESRAVYELVVVEHHEQLDELTRVIDSLRKYAAAP
jgi:hypothetical protein